MEENNRRKRMNNTPNTAHHINPQLTDIYRIDYDSNGFQIYNNRSLDNSEDCLNKMPNYSFGMKPLGCSSIVQQNNDSGASTYHRRYNGSYNSSEIRSNSMDNSYFPANFLSDPVRMDHLDSTTFMDNRNDLTFNWHQTNSLPSGSFFDSRPSLDSISPLPSFVSNTENNPNTNSTVGTRHELGDDNSVSKLKKPSRSMVMLCELFFKRYMFEPESQSICPNSLSKDLNIERRRVYDLINILVGLEVIKKIGRGCCHWIGLNKIPTSLLIIRHHLEKLIKKDRDVNKRDDKSIGYMTRRFLALMISSCEPLDIEEASIKLYPRITEEKIHPTILRRLYDVGIVLCFLGLLNKIRTPKNNRSKRFSYEFTGFHRVDQLYRSQKHFNEALSSLTKPFLNRFTCESTHLVDSGRYYRPTLSEDHSYSIEGLIGGCSSNLSVSSTLVNSDLTNRPHPNSDEVDSTHFDFNDKRSLADHSTSHFKYEFQSGSESLNSNKNDESEFKENLVQLLKTYTPIKRKLLCDNNCNFLLCAFLAFILYAVVNEVISLCEKKETLPEFNLV